jgi:hypothetical protein
MTRTDLNEMVRAAWPWATAFSKQLRALRSVPFHGSHLMFGSDYSGSHSGSQFRTYGFVIGDADSSPEWPARCRESRIAFLASGRRMAFKSLNDRQRRRALIPFLEASESLDGHVVVVAINKKITHISTHQSSVGVWEALYGFQARWDPRAFEEMVRVSHFFSLFLAAWSSPNMNISWMTDEDDIVANAGRLDDAHQFAARLCTLHVPHRLGEFMMNTPAVMPDELMFEDFLAIPDLAAGMISEILKTKAANQFKSSLSVYNDQPLTEKSDIIADWFWHNSGTLKKTCILIDQADDGKFGVGRLQMNL